MNVSKLNRTVLNKNVLNKTNINISLTDFRFSKKQGMENEIMKSLVLWYDIKKQGATNESMAADPRIIDHSGNGHHATCYNFAWSGMSGIGGYYFGAFHNKANNIYNFYTNESKSCVHITSVNSDAYWLYLKSVAVGEKINYRIRITGLDALRDNYPNYDIVVSNTVTNSSFKEIYRSDGEYELSAIVQEGDYMNVGLGIYDTYQEVTYPFDCDVLIEQLPLYPNALVSDGVDDYAMVNGLPIFTKDKGYTVIADRSFKSSLFKISTFATKRTAGNAENGAFQFERGSGNINNFGQPNGVKFSLSGISYATSKEYNGNPIKIGDKEDTDTLTFVRLTPSSGDYGFMAMRSFLLFDRDLTAEEIEWVKTNIIGGNEL